MRLMKDLALKKKSASLSPFCVQLLFLRAALPGFTDSPVHLVFFLVFRVNCSSSDFLQMLLLKVTPPAEFKLRILARKLRYFMKDRYLGFTKNWLNNCKSLQVRDLIF